MLSFLEKGLIYRAGTLRFRRAISFAPAGAVHSFESFSQDFAAWVFFTDPKVEEKPE
jgi:hypothetical protein